MHYLFNDMQIVMLNLANISRNTQAIAKSNYNVASSIDNLGSNFDHLHKAMTSGFDSMENEMAIVSSQLDVLIDEVKLFRDEQFLQNEKRNELLTSIDATLKAPNQTAAQEQYDMAIVLVERGRPEQGLKLLGEAINLNPLHYRAHIKSTLLCLQLRRYTSALQHVKESLIHAPTNSRDIVGYTHYLAARTYEKTNQLNEAYAHITKANQFNRTANYTYETARLLGKMERTSEAMRELVTAIQMDPNYFSQSLADSAFRPCFKELEETLTNLKKSYEKKVDRKLTVIRETVIPNYSIRKNPDKSYRYTNYSGTSGQAGFRGIDVTKNKTIRFSYNSIVDEFNDFYGKLKNHYSYNINRMEHLVKEKTFIAYTQLLRQLNEFPNKFNEYSRGITEFIQRIGGFDQENIRIYVNKEIHGINNKIRELRQDMRNQRKGYFFKRNLPNMRKNAIERRKNSIELLNNSINNLKEIEALSSTNAQEIERFYRSYMNNALPTVKY